MLTTLAIIWVLGVIITAMLAYNHNRNIIGYSVVGVVLSPVISIGVLLMLGERNPNLFINDNRDKVTPVPETVIPEELAPAPEVVEEVVEPVKPVPPVFPEVQVVPEVKKHKSNKSSKKARYTKGKNKGKKPDTQSTSTSTTTTNTPDNASGIATAAVMTALYVGDDYSDYTTTTTYSSSSDSSSYDSSSSCDSSSSSSGSCD